MSSHLPPDRGAPPDGGGPVRLLPMLRRGLRLARGAAPRLFDAVMAVQVVEALTVVGGIVALQMLTAVVMTRPDDADTVAALELAWPVTLLVVSVIVGAVCQSAQPALSTVLGERLAAVTTAEVLRVAGTVPLSDFDHPQVLDRLKRVETGSLVRPAQLAVGLGILLSGVVGGAAVTVAVLAVQPWLAAVALAAAAPLWWAARRDGAQTYQTVRGLSRLERRRIYLAGLLTRRERAAEIRALHLTPLLLNRHQQLSAERYREVSATAWSKARRQLAARAAGGLLLAFGLGSLLLLVVTGRLGLPDAVAAAAAGAALRGRFSDAAAGIRQLQEAAEFVDDHAQLLAGSPGDDESAEAGSPTSSAAGGDGPLSVRLRGVCLRYPGAAVDAVSNVDLELRTGQVTALVGANGSGKSTLAAIVAGLLVPTGGEVLWNGINRRDLHESSWRPDIAMLLQDAGRYQEQLRDNVGFGATDRPPNDNQIRAALAQAGAAALLGTADGLGTDLGREQDGGVELSGGSWQRIAIARTFYRGGRLLILDEPSAPLDPVAERDLILRLRGSFADRAVLLITHRMPAALTADHVVALHDGSIIEQGDPHELLGRKGAFATMCAAAEQVWEPQNA